MLLTLVQQVRAPVRRPSQASLAIDFENLASSCNFAEGIPLTDEYSASGVSFSGPGFGALNGGVPLDVCALSSGAFPPLGNASVAGSGFLGFSTIHTFNGRTGKPIAPETVRFDVRTTNFVISLAGIDGHSVTVDMWSGPLNSFNDGGVLLHSVNLVMTHQLQSFDLVDENDLFIDCVRRLEIASPAKMFLLDNLRFDISSTDDAVCVDDPAIAERAAADASSSTLAGTSTGASSRRRRADIWITTLATFGSICSLWIMREWTLSRGKVFIRPRA